MYIHYYSHSIESYDMRRIRGGRNSITQLECSQWLDPTFNCRDNSAMIM